MQHFDCRAGLAAASAAPEAATAGQGAASLDVPTQRVEVDVPMLAALAALPPSKQHESLVAQALAGLGRGGSGEERQTDCEGTPVAPQCRGWYMDRKLWVV